MSKKIVILVLPGIGTKEKEFSKAFQADVHKFSKGTPLANNTIVVEGLPFKESQVDKNQSALFDRIDKISKLGGPLSPRKFVLAAFGDGVTFERDSNNPDSTYHKIHKYLKSKIEEANQIVQEHEESKLVIVAASMGVHLISTYIWDADKGKGIFEDNPSSANNNLRNLSYMATIGCNIPLFVSGLPESKIIAIEKRNSSFEWDNYYDRDDVLGWPLQQISNSYNDLVNDHEINTGLYVGSHVKYWDDNDFTEPFTEKLVKLY